MKIRDLIGQKQGKIFFGKLPESKPFSKKKEAETAHRRRKMALDAHRQSIIGPHKSVL